MLKRKKKIIIKNYEQLCILYNIWSAGLKEFSLFKLAELYINTFHTTILKSELLGVILYPKMVVKNQQNMFQLHGIYDVDSVL